eukprot:GFUD01129177.1.p1 GENE.GFUD01129177.1~~GFUD01129177.1.p1  ORF type:complete len:207 (-),score=44.60 GFUD01129177.1:389-1009(-)
MATELLLLSLLVISPANSLFINDCGLRMEVFINNDQAAYIRCSDTIGSANPSWLVNNMSDYHHNGLAELKLFGVSFTVLSLQWMALPQGQATVECRGQDLQREEECRESSVVGVVRKQGRPEPRDQTKRTPVTSAITPAFTTARTPATTTRRRGAFFFPGERPSTCFAVGQFRTRPGMTRWCMNNCNRRPPHCPAGVCRCGQDQPR